MTSLRITTLAVALCAAAPAFAQETAASQRVEISATRYDVRTVCPTIDDDLRMQLARRLSAMPPQALVHVAFQLDGRRIADVEATGSTPDARRAVRQAVQQIGCDGGDGGRQRVRFDVVYRWDAEASTTVAMFTGR